MLLLGGIGLIVVFNGFAERTTVDSEIDWPPIIMLSPVDVPEDEASIEPWIEAFLIFLDAAEKKEIIDLTLKSSFPELKPLVEQLSDYYPCQVLFSEGIGYVRCVRQFKDPESGDVAYDVIYIAQGLSNEALEERVGYFDPETQPLAREFLQRFAGAGEEMEGQSAGQFCFKHWNKLSDYFDNEDIPGDWLDARVLYAALCGDSVLIKPNGATAWHTLETGEVSPIADTLQEFLQAYADFRRTHNAFDSWTFREFRGGL